MPYIIKRLFLENNINKKQSNYFIRLFKGEISLPMTYWVWFLFLNFIIVISSSFYFNSMPLEPTKIQKNIVLLIIIFVILYSIFILIAVWRSASNHDGSKFWAIIAKIIVIINFINLISDIYNVSKVFTNEQYALVNSIKQLNKRTPLKVNDNIHITKALIHDKSIYYTYRLNNIRESKLPNLNITMINDNVLKESCKDEQVIKALKDGYRFHYYYTNNVDKKLAEIKIINDDCIKFNEDENILRKILNKDQK